MICAPIILQESLPALPLGMHQKIRLQPIRREPAHRAISALPPRHAPLASTFPPWAISNVW